MVRRPPLPLLVVALALVAGTACQAEGDAGTCSEIRCEVTITGSPTLEVFDIRFKADVGPDRVRVAGGGVDVTLNPGDAAVVEGVRVQLLEVAQERARLVLVPVDARFARLGEG
ncbi:hypothetical protein JOD54_000123 [Actinokineospora baliensis]|uniref:hypothetical protein n=1 Tax=Actinokineospora baliensis TaxID=547056 RepID=UPI001957AD62|nr:hypothetical protein [Actinokineospora baliensis]MBM7769919.1 hypothetical protein [Actinokineospora baliensis]